ncbi:hypothetical protein V8G54_012177 [Vigna mungo]|uniref:Uncharacterized protein n=1 Tax=Vigna mungo TaxID=3915 RepID=A0AAQ3S3J8_VIGMU
MIMKNCVRKVASCLIWLKISVRYHTFTFFHKTISSPVFVRLQAFLYGFPLLNCFLLPSHQLSVSGKVVKRNPVILNEIRICIFHGENSNMHFFFCFLGYWKKETISDQNCTL